ncbi:MAG: sigma-70 family RNA polymerase sigma factor [Alphaproteobacteria bacterium]
MSKYEKDIRLAADCVLKNEKAWSNLISIYRNDCIIISRKFDISHCFDELFSELILKLCGKPGQLKGALERYDGSTSLKTYLSVVFSRIVISYLRKIKTRNFIIFSDKSEELFQPKETTTTEDDCKEELSEAIAQLPKPEKNLIELYYFQELKLRQIAEIFKCSESKISRQIKKIHEKLKRILQEN